MTVRIMVSQELNTEERFAVMDAIADTLTEYGKRPATIHFVKVAESAAGASA